MDVRILTIDVKHAYELVMLARSSYYHRCCPLLYRSNTLTPGSFAVISADLPLFIHMRMACSLNALS
jgi:hypothetical protein